MYRNSERRAACNSGFKKLAVQSVNEVLCFVSSSVWRTTLCFEIANFLNPQNVNPYFENSRQW